MDWNERISDHRDLQQRRTIRKCLTTLLQPFDAGTDLDIVIVDNASADSTRQELANWRPRIRVIQNESNLGFARACNMGVKVSGGEALLFLNPDAYASRQAIDICQSYLDSEPDIGIVACRLSNGCGMVQPSWARFPKPFSLRPFNLAPEPSSFHRHPARDVDWLLGAFLMTRRSMYGDRLFDEDYFLYGEDMDLCYRVRQAGWRVVLVQDETVEHDGQSGWTAERLSRVYTSTCIFMRKHFGCLPSLVGALATGPALLRSTRLRGWRDWQAACILPFHVAAAAIRARRPQPLHRGFGGM